MARRPAALSLTRWILHAILCEPSLAARVDCSHLDPNDRFHPALVSVLDLLAQRPGLSARDVYAAAIDASAGSAAGELLREAQAEVLASDKEVSAAEFVSALTTLRDRVERRRITELIARTARTNEEAAELVQLQRNVSERARQPAEKAGSSV